MKIKSIKTHSVGNGCFILSDAAKFAIVYDNYKSGVFNATDGAAILKAVYGIETAVYRAKLKFGNLINSDIPYTVEVLGETSVIDGDYHFLSMQVSVNNPDTWELTLYSNNKAVGLPNGCVDDICEHLKAEGVEMPRSYGKYDSVSFTAKLPESTEAIIRQAYVLTKADGDKPVDSVWVWTGVRYEEVSDGPAPEPNPEDASTIPDSPVKEEVTAPQGSASTPTTQMWDKAIKNTTVAATAQNEVSIVNCTVDSGVINATVA